MYDKTATGDTERSAFRTLEKKYKLYYDSANKKKKQPREVDLSEVFDFGVILETYHQNGQLPNGVSALPCGSSRPVLLLDSHPGFYFLPGALTVEEQCQWIRESLTSFPQPPNRTNHNAVYGHIHDLFLATKERKVLVDDDDKPVSMCSKMDDCVRSHDGKRWIFCGEEMSLSREKGGKAISAAALLRKLRWSTLGLQFDWSKRNYDVFLPHNEIPDALCQLARRLATPAMPEGQEFHPEAAIVNYFGLGDTLGGHLDDMEADWSKPIVSMSLGCKAIFLLGGKSGDEMPLAMFLRSGDAILMAGEARECFHGVPRIFTDERKAEIADLEQCFSEEKDFLDYIRSSRININIRQVL